MNIRKIAIASLALALIAAFFAVSFLSEPSTGSADDHNCNSEHCIVCLVSTLLSKSAERLIPLLWAVLLFVPSALFFVHHFFSSNDLSARRTPVFLKVKLLN